MCGLLNRIIERGGTTAFRGPFTEDRMIRDFLEPPLGISCLVADSGDGVTGFQALEWSDPNWIGPNPLPTDWAFISTYVARGAQGQGVGRRLFEATLAAATAAKVVAIDAKIRKENLVGQAFYGSLGFIEYRSDEESVSKRFVLLR
ncbi:GNAT family N-acetyltransferase [Algihabitans albus]|uniref:GNAT family N-acetyltransferase n=1 Tax=Algihabitans albus TaxID=2164067 RepID=UPI0013C3075C|nr:GNAT family N-acetyltransferase [Algihabitans albus]